MDLKGKKKVLMDIVNEGKTKSLQCVKKQKPMYKMTQNTQKQAKSQPDFHTFLVQEFAIRWHYALPSYPPLNFDYSPALKKLNSNVKLTPVPHFPGLFTDAQKVHDLRPQNSKIIKPTLRNFQNMDTNELLRLLKIAVKKQICELNKSGFKSYDLEFEKSVLMPNLQILSKKLQ